MYNGDYYTLDAIMYEAKDDGHFAPHLTYAKYIAVALEHENDSKTSLIEVNKLQLFNTPLKVLITYDRNNRMTKTLLGAYRKIVRDADVFGDFATSRRVLVIITKPGKEPGRCCGEKEQSLDAPVCCPGLRVRHQAHPQAGIAADWHYRQRTEQAD